MQILYIIAKTGLLKIKSMSGINLDYHTIDAY